MMELAAAKATKGSPMANQVLGIQKIGDFLLFDVVGKIEIIRMKIGQKNLYLNFLIT